MPRKLVMIEVDSDSEEIIRPNRQLRMFYDNEPMSLSMEEAFGIRERRRSLDYIFEESSSERTFEELRQKFEENQKAQMDVFTRQLNLAEWERNLEERIVENDRKSRRFSPYPLPNQSDSWRKERRRRSSDRSSRSSEERPSRRSPDRLRSEEEAPRPRRYNTAEENARLEANYIKSRNYAIMTEEEQKKDQEEKRRTLKYAITERCLRAYNRLINSHQKTFRCQITIDRNSRHNQYQNLILKSDFPSEIDETRKELDAVILEEVNNEYEYNEEKGSVRFALNLSKRDRQAVKGMGIAEIRRVVNFETIVEECKRCEDSLPPLFLNGKPRGIQCAKEKIEKKIEEYYEIEVEVKISLPSNILEHFFGAKRAVEELEDRYNTRIEVIKEENRLKIRGSQFDIDSIKSKIRCFESIAHQIPDPNDEAVHQLSITRQDTPRVIGKKGAQINWFRAESGAKCFLMTTDTVNNQMIISGTDEVARRGYAMVHKFLTGEEMPENDYLENHSEAAKRMREEKRRPYRKMAKLE